MTRFRMVLVLLALLAGLLVESCKKEYSYEGGITNEPPIAVAGNDQLIRLPLDSTLLDGSASTDPDGRIVAWRWTRIAGPSVAVLRQPDSPRTIVDELVAGTYQLSLQVTDDQGLTDTDTVLVTVQLANAQNRPPVACAGPDQTITLPLNRITLDGSCSTDPDNDIVSYQWIKLSGPTGYQLLNSNQPVATATDLVAGVFVFQLTVRDAAGLFATDTVRVTVSASDPATDSLDVFVAGNENAAPVYWKNGQIVALTISPQLNGDAMDIAVVGSSVYVCGWEGDFLIQRNNRAKYWQNGQEVFLTGAVGAGANGIAVSGNEVHVVGWQFLGGVSVAVYWRNGVATILSDGTSNAEATDIKLVGPDVYISGYDKNKVTYWRNGQAFSPATTGTYSYAFGLDVAGNDVYLAGFVDGKATYWANNQAFTLGGITESYAMAIAVSGTTVCVAGQEGVYGKTVARYWRNGQVVALGAPNMATYATDLAIWGDDVFVSGFDIGPTYSARYWRNGQDIILSKNPSAGNAILVRQR